MKIKDPGAVTFYSYPKLLFCWPVIALGYLLFFLMPSMTTVTHRRAEQALQIGLTHQQAAARATSTPALPPTAPADKATTDAKSSSAQSAAAPYTGGLEWAGWLYLLVVAIVLLTLGIDLERNYAVFWLVFILGFYFLGMWLHDVKHFTLFGDIYRWFSHLNVLYNKELGLALSILLTPPFLAMLLWVRINHKWRITHNEFEHYAWGRADDSLARGAKRVRSTYPDLLELLLCGAGTLVVYSATGKQELRRIRHVPLLFYVRKRINRLLESTAITNANDAIVEEEMAEEVEGAATEESDTENDGEHL